MKRLAFSGMFIFLILIQFSCGSDGEPDPDIELSKVLEQSISISVISKDEITATAILDATKDSEISKYKNNIKQYEITSLEFAIENYSSSLETEVYFDGKIGFSKQGASFPAAECSVSSMPVTHWAGTSNFTIGNCDDLIGQVETILTGENGIKLYMTGAFTDEPLTFDLKVIANVKITANPG